MLGPRAARVIAGASRPPVAICVVTSLTCLFRYWLIAGLPNSTPKTISNINWSKTLTAPRTANFMLCGWGRPHWVLLWGMWGPTECYCGESEALLSVIVGEVRPYWVLLWGKWGPTECYCKGREALLSVIVGEVCLLSFVNVYGWTFPTATKNNYAIVNIIFPSLSCLLDKKQIWGTIYWLDAITAYNKRKVENPCIIPDIL